ncbi:MULTISPECIES: GIY-YIG nuclease family protein [unclassified Mucilaginibacter]|uniref:GIY-YIG nuclease family protein n=2 Tax=Mucilaginibacter TaxID=423349 RepID=UPI000A54627C
MKCSVYGMSSCDHWPVRNVMPNLFRHPTKNSLHWKHTHSRDMLIKQPYVYIMSNSYRTTFYIGVTSDLRARIWQHLNNEGSLFVKKYRLFDLMYYESFDRITDAIDREKQLKNWHRDWKINLIKSINPEMKDLKHELD